MSIRLLSIVGLAVGLTLTGCVQQQATTEPPAINTGLGSLASTIDNSPKLPAPTTVPPEPTAALANANPIDIQTLLDRATPPPPEPAPVEEPKVPVRPEPEIVSIEAPPKTLAEQIDDASLKLIDLLRQDAVGGGVREDAFHSAMALAALEAVRPGSAAKVITPDSTDGGTLTDEQRTLVTAFKDLVTGLMAASQEKKPKPDFLSDRAAELADIFIGTRPMRIRSAMVAKVTGFGQYIPLGNGKYQQGKPIRAVIYTEVSRFQHRPIKEGDTARGAAQAGDAYAVELSQELQLYHDADGVKAWQHNEQPIIETSRNKKHDFYLVESLTLPPTLSIGAYKLKVIVRDKTSGQEVEAIIPFEVVADPALASDTGTRIYD